MNNQLKLAALEKRAGELAEELRALDALPLSQTPRGPKRKAA